MAKTRQSHEDRMAVIVQHAADIFSQHGYHKASVQDIADSLALTKGGLYHYVESKDQLLYECHRRAMDLVLPGLEKIVASEDVDPLTKLHRAVQNHLDVLTDEFNLITVLLQQEYALLPNYKRHISRLRNEYDQLLGSIIEEGKAQRVFRKEVDTKMTVYFLVGSLNWIPHWYRKTGKLSLAQIGDIFFDNFATGIVESTDTIGVKRLG